MGAQWIAEHFQGIQGALLIGFILIGALTWKSQQQKSRFRVREADRPPQSRTATPSAHASKKTPPQFLPGVRLHGAPHEILGIREGADEVEIMRAFKDLMKKYHPDRIQNVAPDQARFYQDAATQINQAKEKMIAEIKKKSGSQNG